MASDSGPLQRPLPYVGQLALRELNRIKLLVIHCTELPDLATARRYGEQIHYTESGTGNSGHFYIDRDGRTEQWVPLERVAHHVRGWNEHSIGVELVNRGRFPDWFDSRSQALHEPYAPAQIEALLSLVQDLRRQLPALTRIAGHEDLDQALVPASDDGQLLVARKRDPGPTFPWQRMEQEGCLERWQPDL